jgi:alcohol dehydrogenase
MSGVGAGDHCIVVGASGSIGTMMMGNLKSLDCIVTGVGSGGQTDFMLRNGADDVVDYRTDNFADHVQRMGHNVDAVFDCVGGRETESDGFRALGDRGVFVTTRFRAKRYIFGEKPPRRVIDEALTRSVRHDIQMPIADVIPFDLEAIKSAVNTVLEHRSKGRIVIAFE